MVKNGAKIQVRLVNKVIFNEIYDPLIKFEKIDVTGVRRECHGLQIAKNERTCMFCAQSYPDVKFSKIAHAVSESIGNKTLFNHFECDKCNSAFGQKLEDAFGKYIAPFKFVSQIKGKNGTITIKDMPEDKELSYKTYRLERGSGSNSDKNYFPQDYIIEKSGRGIFRETEEGFAIEIPRNRYNPRLVYAALLKMGYSLLPIDLWDEYAIGITSLGLYVRNEPPFDNNTESEKYINGLPNKGILAQFPGINPLNGVSAFLYQRNEKAPCEYTKLLFRLDFFNFSILIPIVSDRETQYSKFVIPAFQNNPSISVIDFSKEEKIYTAYFSAEKIPIEKNMKETLVLELRERGLLKKP